MKAVSQTACYFGKYGRIICLVGTEITHLINVVIVAKLYVEV